MINKLIFVLFCVSISMYSQSERRIFYGVISDNIGVIPNVHIVNTTSKKAVFSLVGGNFEIFTKVNDSLKITCIGYKTKFIKVAAHHFGIQTNIIKLETDVVQLKEVEIKRHNLSGMLSTDAKKAVEKPIISAETLNLPNAGLPKLSPAERKLNLAQGGRKNVQIGLFSSVSLDLIINSLSGRLKKAKMMKEFEDQDNTEKELVNSFSIKSYIKKDLGISSSEVLRFINFCQQDKNCKTAKKSELYFLEFLRKKSEEFKKLQENE